MNNVELYWQLMHNTRRIREIVEKKIYPFCTQQGITPLGFRVVLAVYFEVETTITALARQTCTAGANNSTLCKRLAAQGYLERKRGLQDERQVNVRLAPKGEELVQKFIEYYNAELGAADKCEREAAELVARMERLLASVEQE